MKEFSLDLNKYLSNGLRKSDQDSINSPFFLSLKNAKVKDNGIRPYAKPGDLFDLQPNLVASGEFVVDPTGSTSLDTWTLGSRVAYNSGTDALDWDAVVNGQATTCTLSATKGIDQGEVYYIVIVVSGYTQGTIQVSLGGTTIAQEITGAGTFGPHPMTVGVSNYNLVLTSANVISSATLSISSVKLYRKDSKITAETYPYPMIHIGQADTVALYNSRVYTGSSGYDSKPLSIAAGYDALAYATVQSVYDVDNISNLKTVTYSSTVPPDFIDFQTSWYIISSSGMTFKSNWGSINDEREGKVIHSDYPKVNTGTYHRGRVIIGGFNASNVWNSDWLSLWDRWKDMLPHNVSLTEEAFTKNYILWSGIGEGLLWLVYPQIAVSGLIDTSYTYSVDYPYFFEMIRKNDIGWMPLPCRGSVRKIRPLVEHIIVYADDGIFALTPMVDPAPGYRVKQLADFGIHQSWGVGEGNEEHLFIDVTGRMWKVKGDLTLEYLDYNEFVGSTTDIIDSTQDYNFITFNPIENEYYLGDKDKAYTLTEQGLSEISATPISTWVSASPALNSKGTFRATYVDHTSVDRFELETEIFDINLRAIKQITFVNLGFTIASGKEVEVRIGARSSNTGSFNYSGWLKVNNEGFVTTMVSGVDFKLGIRTGDSSDYESMKLSSISLGWKLSDKRAIRSQYAS